MVKHTQKIRGLLPKNCLSVFDHFVGFALEVLNSSSIQIVYGSSNVMFVKRESVSTIH